MTDRVSIYEVGPRDGLQNQTRLIPAASKIALVDMLSLSGFSHIEVTSFVSPKWVPQMGDATEVMAGITRKPGVTYAALTPNLRGFEAALAAGAGEVAIFASASEGFSQRNINCSVAESLDRFGPIAAAAQAAAVPLRGYISCVTDCPYDGATPPDAVADLATRLIGLGCREVSLGDTLGRATPATTAAMLDAVLVRVPAGQLAGHFHDTGGRALDNIATSLARGLRVFDASCGGLGGCPYAPGAAGNVASEAVAAMLDAMGLTTGLDHDLLAHAATYAKGLRL
jgi:hydroxymethylglutaryl-CoA lyase